MFKVNPENHELNATTEGDLKTLNKCCNSLLNNEKVETYDFWIVDDICTALMDYDSTIKISIIASKTKLGEHIYTLNIVNIIEITEKADIFTSKSLSDIQIYEDIAAVTIDTESIQTNKSLLIEIPLKVLNK